VAASKLARASAARRASASSFARRFALRRTLPPPLLLLLPLLSLPDASSGNIVCFEWLSIDRALTPVATPAAVELRNARAASASVLLETVFGFALTPDSPSRAFREYVCRGRDWILDAFGADSAASVKDERSM
jgi:hypothetical protein